MAALIYSDNEEIVDEVIPLIEIIAPGSVIFEIHLFIKLKSLYKKDQKMLQLCNTLHLRFNENLYHDFSFIDYSSLCAFECWKWFLEWYTALKVNEASIIYIMIIDNSINDLLLSVRFFTEAEHSAVKGAKTSCERTNKFIEVFSSRYPSDVDFIMAELQEKKAVKIADYFKTLKEKAMKIADPCICENERISADSLEKEVSLCFAIYIAVKALQFV